jgi:catechol-2,3-dioxygenase
MSTPKEIGHVVLNVTDVERSTKFDRDVVGFQVSRYRPDGTGAFLTCGVVHHDLVPVKAPEGARPIWKGAIGLNHFAFKVESYQALGGTPCCSTSTRAPCPTSSSYRTCSASPRRCCQSSRPMR